MLFNNTESSTFYCDVDIWPLLVQLVSIQAQIWRFYGFSSHLLLQKPPDWHHKARMVGRSKLLKETRGERWRFMSEVFSLAVLWVDSKTYRGNLDEF